MRDNNLCNKINLKVVNNTVIFLDGLQIRLQR